MIKAIIFDFDGVIMESSQIKTRAFQVLFSDYPERLQEIIAYHKQNMGISRFVKFKYIYGYILRKKLSSEEESRLGERFSEIVKDEVIKAPFVAGIIDFLKQNNKKYYYFIISGTPQDELLSIIRIRNIADFFKEIQGAPQEKTSIINGILKKYGLKKKEVVFIGDAESDRIAAEESGIGFIARVNDASSPNLEKCPWKIKDFSEVEKVLSSMDISNKIKVEV